MRPFEFVIQSRPVSQQTRHRDRLREWQDFVRREAQRFWSERDTVREGAVCLTLVYLCEESPLDLDNIIKPIQDALVGVAFPDDSLVTDLIGRRRRLGETFDFNRVSPVLIRGFEPGGEFVYVHVGDAPPQEQLL